MARAHFVGPRAWCRVQREHARSSARVFQRRTALGSGASSPREASCGASDPTACGTARQCSVHGKHEHGHTHTHTHHSSAQCQRHDMHVVMNSGGFYPSKRGERTVVVPALIARRSYGPAGEAAGVQPGLSACTRVAAAWFRGERGQRLLPSVAMWWWPAL